MLRHERVAGFCKLDIITNASVPEREMLWVRQDGQEQDEANKKAEAKYRELDYTGDAHTTPNTWLEAK